MRVARGVGVVVILAGTALGAVALRWESASAAWRIHQLEGRRQVLRRELWEAQLEIARLSSPERIRERASKMELSLEPPAGGGAGANGTLVRGPGMPARQDWPEPVR